MQDKLRELKLRESEAWERIKNRERDLDKQQFEVRQRQLHNEEVIRAKETEAKKTLEVDLHMARTERDSLSKAQRECELKVKELEVHRLKIDKEHMESIERFKSELQRSFADQDFDIHRRKLQLEEDEQRVRLERDRIAQIQTSNEGLNKEVLKLKAEHDGIVREN